MKSSKKLIVGFIPILCIGIVLGLKPIVTKNISINSNTYGAPANSAFADENFYKCVVDAYNTENNTNLGYDVNLTDIQLQSITKLNCSGSDKSSTEKISDVSGLDKIKNLLELNLDNNPITSIDLSKNESIKKLSLIGNGNLKGLDLNKNVALTELKLSSSGFNSIDLSKNTSLTYLQLNLGFMKNIDLSKNVNLVHLYVDGQSLNSIDLSKNTGLEELQISFRNLNNMDLSANTKLVSLTLNGFGSSNNNITNLDLSNNVNLTKLVAHNIISLENINLNKNTDLIKLDLSNDNLLSIDLKNNTKLAELNLNGNKLTEINLSNNTFLEQIRLNNNQLSNIDLSKNVDLKYLYLNNNQLTNIDVSKNTALERLYLDDNKIGNIDVSNNLNLRDLYLNNNKLTSIDVNNNIRLNSLYMSNNQLTNIDLSNNENLSSLFLNNNQLSSVSIFSGNINNTVIFLSDLDLSNNNFNIEKYLYKKYNFSELPDTIVLPKKAYEFLSISNAELCTFEDNVCTFNNDGINDVEATYKTISQNKIEGYWSFPIKFKFYVIDATSDKYIINDEKNYIDTNTDVYNNDTLLNNISINQIDGVNAYIENNKYVIKHNEEVIKEFDLVNYSSNNYDLNQDYINVNDNNISSFLSNINCINCHAYVYDGTDNLRSGEFKDNYKLRIMYNDEILKDYELRYSVSGVSLNTNNIKLNLDSKKTSQLSANITPTNAENKNVTWTSSNPGVATVDENGLVTAKSLGEVTITVKTEDGEFIAECNVVVSEITTYTVTYKNDNNTYTEEYEEGENITFKSDLDKKGYKLIGFKYNNKEYKLTDKLTMPSSNIELVAIWELVIPEIKNYQVNEGDINGIPLKTDVNNINLGIDSIYDVKVYNHDGTDKTSGLIATGDKIKIYLDELLVSEYEVIIRGDVTGTGTSTVSDVAKLYQYLKKKINMDECFIKAGNVVDTDDEIKVNDVAKLYQFIKGKIDNL